MDQWQCDLLSHLTSNQSVDTTTVNSAVPWCLPQYDRLGWILIACFYIMHLYRRQSRQYFKHWAYSESHYAIIIINEWVEWQLATAGDHTGDADGPFNTHKHIINL